MLKANSTLHVGKGLAVSLVLFPISFTPKGAIIFRIRRHCSHLAYYYGQGLPATIFDPEGKTCPDFPHDRNYRAIILI